MMHKLLRQLEVQLVRFELKEEKLKKNHKCAQSWQQKVFSCEDEEYACLRELRKVSGWGQDWKSSLGPTFLGFLVTNPSIN